jgi:hypothetical protein
LRVFPNIRTPDDFSADVQVAYAVNPDDEDQLPPGAVLLVCCEGVNTPIDCRSAELAAKAIFDFVSM